MESDTIRDKRRNMRLKQYYTSSDESEPHIPQTQRQDSFSAVMCDPMDINSPDFNADMYISRRLKEHNISQLMEEEQMLHKQIQSLDNEMQTLVYENYNKFISATETVRKMSSHFDKMEEELRQLSGNVDEITKRSEKISKNLKVRREDLTKLSNTHSVLQKLQFLFELSPKMKSCVVQNEYLDAVKYYLKAEKTLERYRHFPSIQAIDVECRKTLDQLKNKLLQQFTNDETSQQKLTESIDLLLQLKESPEQLANEYLTFSKRKMDVILSELQQQIDLSIKGSTDSNVMDILEFVDLGCNGILGNIASLITSFDEMFIQRFASNSTFDDENALVRQLTCFVDDLMDIFLDKMRTRFISDRLNLLESSIYVRALDRFYRRLQNLNKIYSYNNFLGRGLSVVQEVTEKQCLKILDISKEKFVGQIQNVRHLIITSFAARENKEKIILSEILITLETTISEQIKSSLAGLANFIDPDVRFCARTSFQEEFSQTVREAVVTPFLRFIVTSSLEYKRASIQPPTQLILLLSRLCLDLEHSIIQYLISYTEDKFPVVNNCNITSVKELRSEAKECSQQLLDHFVRLEGQNISQMIKKSVETRDWLSTVEPRSVRSVMKRVVEDISDIDAQVSQIYEEGNRTDRSSESSKNRRNMSGVASKSFNKSNWSTYSAGSLDNSIISNIQKLFSEKIEIFSSVEFSKLSVVSGIIKIGLKTFLECVRLATFSRFGLQQVQVDAYYLQTHLWCFVTDENFVHSLLEEVLVSAVHRCLDPVMMEPSVCC
ncbi:vacuolar protein sorting-associated protein 51-like protein [Leptotrombidium deliense]|uniref:Vacuolar protein sorting-associated protein 51 homolog n=1 Tax=Leptotrombidium deliense TaxID=299467 RepID=A0A443SLD0_9ACAR|nr:vacuolar protein sorting-associated protein 51-like protein [Leptotrombidium deliense]